MPSTVNASFTDFLKNSVNLDPQVTTNARASRDWLRGQLALLHDRNPEFPPPYSEKHSLFGSFARRTKIRELDDVDLIHTLKATGATYLDRRSHVEITPLPGTVLWKLRDSTTNLLNSRKVVNLFVADLKSIHQYSNSGVNRRGEAAVLNLKSYAWSFDIVPGFFTAPETDGRTYYLIPNGNGHWQKTDPRLDQTAVSQVNQFHDGRILELIRLTKYWNRRPTMPSIPSYVLESLIVSYYNTETSKATQWLRFEFAKILGHIQSAIFEYIADPKQIQGNLNQLSLDERVKIAARSKIDYNKSMEAMGHEVNGDHKSAISSWVTVFGKNFPSYST